MTITHRSSLAQVAGTVSATLREAGFTAVLTGGACASIYSDGAYQSHDLDFVLQAGGSQRALEQALSRVGFVREGQHYVHPATRFFVEFPRGPLAIGRDVNITPVELKTGRGRTLALSPTDACRDRLAAFYHWSDRESLRSALAIARRHRVNMAAIRRWSMEEGHADRCREFEEALKRRRGGR